jgi:hypothetical protein
MSGDSAPGLFQFRGEMILADIAYRTLQLTRGMTASQFKVALDAIDKNRIPIAQVDPTNTTVTTTQIADRFEIVASTFDSTIRARLGDDNKGGTSSGFQALILRDRNNGQYFLTVAGVSPLSELQATFNSRNTYGFRYEWSRDLVQFMDIASRQEGVSRITVTVHLFPFNLTVRSCLLGIA